MVSAVALRLVTAPTEYPVTLEEAKAHLNVDHDDDDAVITAFIAAATGYAERFLGRALIDQTWDLYLDAFPTGAIEIPLPPLFEVVGVFYLDGDGDEQEFAADSYDVDAWNAPGRVLLTANGSWPTLQTVDNAVRVRFRAGYIDASESPAVSNVPPEIKVAILLHAGSFYHNRENIVVGQTVAPLPFGAEMLLRPHRVLLGMA